jgi:hypothetical protein
MSKDNLESSIYAEFYNMENLPFEKNLPVDALCKTTQFIWQNRRRTIKFTV